MTEDPGLIVQDDSPAAGLAVVGEPTGDLSDLYRAEIPGLLRLAFVMTGSEERAQDAVHDAFVRVGARLATLTGSPAAYLRVAVVNECRSVGRRERRGAIPAAGERAVMPSELVELRDVLQRLPERQRAAVVLRYVTGLGDEDIAHVLGCRRSTVRTLVRRGLMVLRKELS